MREIKFRAWVESGGDAELKMAPAFYMVTQGEKHVETLREFMDVYSGHTLMQFTGLKDKNGKEIYEGDIVDATGYSTYSDASKVSDVFANEDGQWQVREQKDFGHGLPVVWGGWESIRVVGNIYEHPNLLNSEQNVQECDATKDDQGTKAGKQNTNSLS